MRKQIQFDKMLSFITVCLLYSYSSSAQVVGTPYIALSNYVITFNYTGAQQTWTVPTGVTSIKVNVSGAQGGGNTTTNGKGGLVTATLSVTPGQVLAIVVGGQPTSNTAVYGFGGTGGLNTAATTRNGYAGGGLSGLFLSSVSFANALAIAGGGGGTNGLNTYGGGAAGAPNGSNGAQGNWGGRQEGGRGATQSAGGAIGVGVDTQSTAPGIGNQLSGGNGGSVGTSTWTGGGGGGGGYYGDGGGAGGGASVGAGGGGSSYVKTTVGTNIVYTSGANTGNGKVVISY